MVQDMLIDVGLITIEPFEIEKLHSLEINRVLNNHATLYVRATLKDGQGINPVSDATETTKIKCSNGDQIYFNGVIQEIKITHIDEVYELEAFAISNTIFLDKIKHKRSFQDNGQSYESIVGEITASERANVYYNAPCSSSTVENIMLQYNETDWEFSKRLASHSQSVLIPVTTQSDVPEFHFGVGDIGGGRIETNKYSVSKDFDLARRASQQENPLTEDDIMIYHVKTQEFNFELGEKVSFNDVGTLYVRRASLNLTEPYGVVCIYELCPKAAISTPKFYNPAISGLVLNGTVLNVVDDRVQLYLDIDKEKLRLPHPVDYLFKYSTGYSAEGHTGWYVMPEEGDVVQLMFPKEDEKFAHACSSIRQDDTERTFDPLIKYMRTTFGKEIKWEEKEILITSKDDETYILMHEDDGIKIFSKKPIQIITEDTMDIHSDGDMTITTDSDLKIGVKGDMTTVVDGDMSTTSHGNMTAHTDKNLAVSSDMTTKIYAKMMMDIESLLAMGIKTNAFLDVHSKLFTSIAALAYMKIASKDYMDITTKETMRVMAGADMTIKSIDGMALMTESDMKISSGDDMDIFTAENFAIRAEESIKMTNKENIVEIKPDKGIDIRTDKEFILESADNVLIQTKKDLDIQSEKAMGLLSKDKLSIEASKDLTGKGKDVIINGSSSVGIKSSKIDIDSSNIKMG